MAGVTFAIVDCTTTLIGLAGAVVNVVTSCISLGSRLVALIWACGAALVKLAARICIFAKDKIEGFLFPQCEQPILPPTNARSIAEVSEPSLPVVETSAIPDSADPPSSQVDPVSSNLQEGKKMEAERKESFYPGVPKRRLQRANSLPALGSSKKNDGIFLLHLTALDSIGQRSHPRHPERGEEVEFEQKEYGARPVSSAESCSVPSKSDRSPNSSSPSQAVKSPKPDSAQNGFVARTPIPSRVARRGSSLGSSARSPNLVLGQKRVVTRTSISSPVARSGSSLGSPARSPDLVLGQKRVVTRTSISSFPVVTRPGSSLGAPLVMHRVSALQQEKARQRLSNPSPSPARKPKSPVTPNPCLEQKKAAFENLRRSIGTPIQPPTRLNNPASKNRFG